MCLEGTEGECLGSSNKIEIEKDKVAGVLNWPVPKTVRDIRKFLDLVNYYRRFHKTNTTFE